MAAGLSLKVAQLAEFKIRLNDAIAHQSNHVLPKPVVRCDREVHINELSLEAWKELQQLEPFGPGNPTPVFILKDVTCVRPPRTIGNQGRHLKITVKDPDGDFPTIDAIGWNMGELAPYINQNMPVDIAFTLVKNTWKKTVNCKPESPKSVNNTLTWSLRITPFSLFAASDKIDWTVFKSEP